VAAPTSNPPRGTLGLVLLALGALLVCFFEKPLRHIADHHYTSADLTQDFALTRVERNYTPANRPLSDPVVQMQPWLLHQRAELGAGRFPLWNELSGTGAPHFANAQSAVLSPFSAPYYVLPLRWALLVAPLAKLLCAALCTYLFLRRLALGPWPALTGAVAWTWSGYNVVLLAYPHSAAALVLPAGLLAADVARERLTRREPGAWRALAALIAVLALGVYCGQPEPFAFAAMAIGGYTLFALWEEVRSTPAHPGRWRAATARLLTLASCAGLAAGLGALQLRPFFEYLEHSTLLAERAGPQATLGAGAWPFQFFPNLLGSPIKTLPGWPDGPAGGFESTHAHTSSALVVFLALASLIWIRRSRAHAFFGLVLSWWIVYAFDVLGWGRAAAALVPAFELAPPTRSQPLGVFAACVCAAFALQRLSELAGRRRLVATLGLLAAAGVAAWCAEREAGVRLARLAARSALAPEFLLYAREHVRTMLALFAAGVVAALALPYTLRSRALCQAAVLGAVFLPWGWMLRNYNPTVPDRFVFPHTAALGRLKSLVRDERLVVLSEDTLPPATNLVYGLELPTNYDGLWVRDYDRLWRAHFGAGDNWRAARTATRQGLALVGARLVLTRGSWIPVGTSFGDVAWSPAEIFRASPIVPGLDVAQTFTATADGLQAVRLEVATDGRANRCTLWSTLEDLESGELVDAQSLDASLLRADESGRCELVLRFDPVERSRGRRYRLTLSSTDATSSQCLVALATREFGRVEQEQLVRRPGAPLTEIIAGELRVAGERVQGGLVLDLGYHRELFRRLADVGPYTLWSYEAGAARYQLVDQALGAAGFDAALARTLAADFDPARQVILDADKLPAAAPASAGALEPESLLTVEERRADHVRLQVRRSAPGWLVAAQPFYPGWVARVDGEPVELLRANAALCAVALPAGSHEVTLSYEPRSVREGRMIALASLAAALLFLALARRAHRARLPTAASERSA